MAAEEKRCHGGGVAACAGGIMAWRRRVSDNGVKYGASVFGKLAAAAVHYGN